LESHGIATICISHIEQLGEQLGVPRTVTVNTPMGQPLGAPGDHAGHTRALAAALQRGTALTCGASADRWPTT
jgi:hypothetical protein